MRYYKLDKKNQITHILTKAEFVKAVRSKHVKPYWGSEFNNAYVDIRNYNTVYYEKGGKS